MRHYIERAKKLRDKPEHIRRRIAFGTSAGVTASVFFFWVVAQAGSNPLFLPVSATAVANDPSQMVSPLSTMQASVNEGFKNLFQQSTPEDSNGLYVVDPTDGVRKSAAADATYDNSLTAAKDAASGEAATVYTDSSDPYASWNPDIATTTEY